MSYIRFFMPMTCESNGYGFKGRRPAGRSIVEERGLSGKLTVWAQDLRAETHYSIFMLFEDGGRYAGVAMGSLPVDEKGKGEMRREFGPEELCGFKLADIVGVAVLAKDTVRVVSPLCGYKDSAVSWRHVFYEYSRTAADNQREDVPAEVDEGPVIEDAQVGVDEGPVIEDVPVKMDAAPVEADVPMAVDEIPVEDVPTQADIVPDIEELPPMPSPDEPPPDDTPTQKTENPPASEEPTQPEPEEDMLLLENIHEPAPQGDTVADTATITAPEIPAECDIPASHPMINEHEQLYDPTPIRQFTTQSTQPEGETAKPVHLALDECPPGTAPHSAPLHKSPHRSLEEIFASKERISPFQKQSRKTVWVSFGLPDNVPPPANRPRLFEDRFIHAALAEHGHLILGITTDQGPRRHIIGVPGNLNQETRQHARRLGFAQFKHCDGTHPSGNSELGYWLMFITV